MSRLCDEGYEVIAAAPPDAYSERIERVGFRFIALPMDNKGTNPVTDLFLMFRLYRLFRSEKPDVILTYTPKPNIYVSLVAGLMSISVIPNISGLGNVFIRQSFITRIIKVLYRVALYFPQRVFFQNNDDLHLFVELGLVNEKKVQRIPGSGINTELYAPGDVSEKGQGGIFLLVARMLWDKGVGEFVEAARLLKQQYPEARFQLLGFLDVINPQAVSREQMQQWVDEGVIEYLGESDDVKSFMQEADCVVLPSYREGLPRTLIEGGSMARPLIATDVPGCRDVIDDEVNGYLCEVQNAADLAGKMQLLLDLTEEQRTLMGSQSRKKVIREFDESLVIDAYLNTLHSID